MYLCFSCHKLEKSLESEANLHIIKVINSIDHDFQDRPLGLHLLYKIFFFC